VSLGKYFQTTTSAETVLPVTYVEKYQSEGTKKLFEQYKFASSKNKEYFAAKTYLERLVSDIVFDVRNSPLLPRQTHFFFTSPPSTMYTRGEKAEDSTRELFRQDIDYFGRVFKVRLSHLKHSKAQHIGGNRKYRLANIAGRYTVAPVFKFKVFFILNILKIKYFHITILDDVCSTGGTLLACAQTLERYFQKLQKKKPEIRWTVQVFSIAH
jgi:predicted amidophosphoribosyltransferase